MKTLGLIVVAAVLVVGLYFVAKPKPNNQNSNQNNQTSQTSTQSTTRSFTLVIKNKQLVSGPATIQVNEGDYVSITVTNDADEEVHLHGYDQKLELKANVPGTLSFTADLTGRFLYELEGSGTQIGELDVEPK